MNMNQSQAPSLKQECRNYVGKPLALRFIGLTWTQVVKGESSEYDASPIIASEVEVIPSEFFSQGDVATRGFRGRIRCAGHLFDGMHVITGPTVAVSASPDAPTVFDFQKVLPPTWRIWLSKSELPLPTHSYRELKGTDLISGSCLIAEGTAPPMDWQWL